MCWPSPAPGNPAASRSPPSPATSRSAGPRCTGHRNHWPTSRNDFWNGLREGPKHGYQLLDRLPGLSPHDGRIDLGNLYRLLRALEADDLVRSEWQAEPGPPRRVYRLTASGAGLLEGWARSLVTCGPASTNF